MEQRIPKVYRFVWSGSDFPALYSAAVESAVRADPEARAVIHCFGPRPRAHAFERLSRDPRVSVEDCEPSRLFGALPAHLRRVCAVFDSLPVTALSARSNLLRYTILYLHGGIYLDFDTFTLRPLDKLVDADCFIGEERVWSLDEPRVAGDNSVVRTPKGLLWLAIWAAKRMDCSIFRGRLRIAQRTSSINARLTHLQANNAVMGAVPGAEFLDRLLRNAHAANPFVRYSTGPTLVAHVARTSPHLVEVLPHEYFYGVEPAESFRYFLDRTLQLDPRNAVIHYVGSNSQRFLKRNRVPRQSVIGALSDLASRTNSRAMATPISSTADSSTQIGATHG